MQYVGIQWGTEQCVGLLQEALCGSVVGTMHQFANIA
jgi:hypothetical protein